MKNAYSMILIVIASMVWPPFALSFENESDGFRGIKRGTHISNLPDMEGSADLPGYYLRKNDKINIGEVRIAPISYEFYKGRFCGVFTIYWGKNDHWRMKQTLFQLYGDGDKPNRFMETYRWDGSHVRITLKYDEAIEQDSLCYQYLPITQESIKKEE